MAESLLGVFVVAIALPMLVSFLLLILIGLEALFSIVSSIFKR